MQITYFGTGAAINRHADMMHMLLEDEGTKLYIDTGGGTSLMKRIIRGEIQKPEHLWITHCHSDHLLGVVHILRTHKSGSLTLYCSHTIAKSIEQLMNIVGQSKLYTKQVSEKLINYIYIDDLSSLSLNDWTIFPINLYSQKTEQYGCMIVQGDHKLVFFGDEAITILERSDLKNFTDADWLLCEAFCTRQYEDICKPHEKSHITAYEAGCIAQELRPKHLILSHISDHLLDRSQQLEDIRQEAAEVFAGTIVVPYDNDTISLR